MADEQPVNQPVTRSEFEQLRDQVLRMEAQTSAVSADVAALKTDMTSVKTDVGAVKSDVADVRTTVTSMQDVIKSALPKLLEHADTLTTSVTGIANNPKLHFVGWVVFLAANVAYQFLKGTK